MRQRQHDVAAVAVLEPEDLRDVYTARLLPELPGREQRHQHLLRADRVHLLADDVDDLLVDAPAEREEHPHAGGELADEAAAHEQLVADRLRVGRGSRRVGTNSWDIRAITSQEVSGGGDESVYSTGISEASAIASAAGLAILRRFGRGMPCSIQGVDLVEELVDEDRRLDLLQHAPRARR